MKLNKVKNDLNGKLWCGIAALSAITGNSAQFSKDTIRLAIDDILKKQGRRIKGVYTSELLAALDYMIIDHKQIYKYNTNNKKMYLARFLHGYKPTPNTLYLIIVPNHFIVTDGTTIVDSICPSGETLFHHPCIDDQVIEVQELNDSGLDSL